MVKVFFQECKNSKKKKKWFDLQFTWKLIISLCTVLQSLQSLESKFNIYYIYKIFHLHKNFHFRIWVKFKHLVNWNFLSKINTFYLKTINNQPLICTFVYFKRCIHKTKWNFNFPSSANLNTSSSQSIDSSDHKVGVFLFGILGAFVLSITLIAYLASVQSHKQLFMIGFISIFFYGIIILSNQGLIQHLGNKVMSNFGKQVIEYFSQKFQNRLSNSVYPILE